MAKKKERTGHLKRVIDDMDDGVKNWTMVILFSVLSIFFILSALGGAGVVGGAIYKWLSEFFGLGYYILPTLLILLSISFARQHKKELPATTIFGATLFFISGLALLSILGESGYGGYIGTFISSPLLWLFAKPVSILFLSAFILISLFFMYNTVPSKESVCFWQRFQKNKREQADESEPVIHTMGDDVNTGTVEEIADRPASNPVRTAFNSKEVLQQKNTPTEKAASSDKKKLKDLFVPTELKTTMPHLSRQSKSALPPLSLLSSTITKPVVGDIKENTHIIKRALANFNIQVEMDEVSVGPTVTRYALKPAEGVKLSKISTLKANLALALAARTIRIEAPIPGKSLVGIEVPNVKSAIVSLGSMLRSKEYQQSKKPLLTTLGRGVSGKEYFMDLAKAPHVLIAGTTGAGKSVTIHSLIISLIFRNSPESLRLILVDPKRVELSLYKGLPHLLSPVIQDAKRAIRALDWAINEMTRRYEVLEEHNVVNINSYHETIYKPALEKYEKQYGNNPESDEAKEAAEELPERLPYIVFILDELSDIMSSHSKEIEAGIVRLTQMSRAIGIHLVIATQRPSVNVITGVIKANVPTRIALKVASQTDSRTILDQGGAEALLGLGDMLYSGADESIRIQSAFIGEADIKKVVHYLVKQYENQLPDEISLEVNDGNSFFSQEFSNNKNSDDDLDEKYEEARSLVIEAQQASATFLQRKLQVGYARAARILDELEENSVIGPKQGSKQREVLEQSTTPPQEDAIEAVEEGESAYNDYNTNIS